MTAGALAADPAYVLLGIPDVNGSIRGKALRPAAFKSAVEEGTVMTDLFLALDPLDVPITDYTRFGIRSGAGDLLVRPTPETLRDLSWRPGWQLCLATPSWLDGAPCELASREVLRRVVGELSEAGFESLCAFEYEVRIFDGDGRPMSSGLSYSVGEVLRFDELVRRLEPALTGLGIELSAVHTEAGPGLLEVNIAPRPGLQAADDAAMLKMAVKDVAASLGLRASFLAKTAAGEEGSSGHVHLSCWSDGRNAFSAASPGEPLSPPLAGAIAGIVEHLPAASLLFNPTVNSYKRLVPGWFAPVNATWGRENRSAAVRAIWSDHPDRCRLECRRPGADANPYLALAALVASATDGIRRRAPAPPPVVGDASELAEAALPSSLDEALRAFRDDATLQGLLGVEFSEYYAVSRAWELKAWQQTVTDWERARYEGAV